jgi:type II secretion system protein D
VRKLVDLLDTDKPGDLTVRVLPLKNVQASDLVKEVQPIYQKLNAKSPKESVEIAANERSNSLIILSTEANFKRLSDFVASLDTDEAMEKVTRTFMLKNADAQDVTKQLTSINQDSDSSSRYRYFYYGGESQKATRKPSFVADRRRNAVVVQAPPAQMESIVKMIDELDEPVGEDSLAPRIYQLKFVSAVDIEDVLNELFLKKQERRPYFFYDDFDSDSNQSADRDVGRLYGKVRITSEPYSNALIITSNSKENLQAVEDILKQLDIPSQAGETTVRVALRFAKSGVLANSLNILFAKNGSPPLRQVPQQQQQQQPNSQQIAQSNPNASAQASFELSLEAREDGYFPWLGSNPDNPRGSDGRTATRQVSDLVGRVRVVSDERSNALLVSANLHLLPQILKLVEEMDAPTPQVLIEARILEVQTDKIDKLGVRWSPDGSQVFSGDDFDNSILGTTKGRYTTGFGNNSQVTGPASGELSSAIRSIRSGVLDSTVNLDVLVQFLRRNTDATVLAEPQINIADNEMGRLFVGQQVPFIDRSLTTDQGGLNQSFQYKLVGVILEVTPHINKSGEVSLRIRAESSSIQPNQVNPAGPIVDTRNFRTDVTAKDGEILVLGGIIQKQLADSVRKVPLLGDIPGMGWAFKKKDKVARNVELMVFLRPRITRTPDQAKALLEELDIKAPLIAPWKYGARPRSDADRPPEKAASESKSRNQGKPEPSSESPQP